jgi:hypothetical protein
VGAQQFIPQVAVVLGYGLHRCETLGLQGADNGVAGEGLVRSDREQRGLGRQEAARVRGEQPMAGAPYKDGQVRVTPKGTVRGIEGFRTDVDGAVIGIHQSRHGPEGHPFGLLEYRERELLALAKWCRQRGYIPSILEPQYLQAGQGVLTSDLQRRRSAQQ